MKKSLKKIVLLIIIAFVGYQSVYFKSLKDIKGKENDFNAATFAKDFFNQQLLPKSDSAVAIHDLISLVKKNKEDAFNRYGHALGIGSINYFLVKGEGTAKAVNSNTVDVQLAGDTIGSAVKIATEFVFGNALRDASGKISLSQFSNLSDVNNISMELNKIVRHEVLPPFRKAVAAGRPVRFFGAIELNKERLNLDAIEIIPIRLEFLNQ